VTYTYEPWRAKEAAALIRSVNIYSLMHADGCRCGEFRIFGINVTIHCGKSSEEMSVVIEDHPDDEDMTEVMAAVIDGFGEAGPYYKQVFKRGQP
jgi:hypothetical protein